MIEPTPLEVAVRSMRAAQRAYFKERSPANLIRSKELERLVDGILRELEVARARDDGRAR